MHMNQTGLDTKKNTRILNGYRVLYKPDHPYCMTSENWKGYVYEHRYLIEKALGRELAPNEHVHHLDFDRSNNRTENLLLLTSEMHSRLHSWLAKGAPICESSGENGVNSRNTRFLSISNHKTSQAKYCQVCEGTLQDQQAKACSRECFNKLIGTARIRLGKAYPTEEELLEDLTSMPYTKVGIKYGVSDNTIRKWLKKYERAKSILSQAASTLAEGAETSGGVEPP